MLLQKDAKDGVTNDTTREPRVDEPPAYTQSQASSSSPPQSAGLPPHFSMVRPTNTFRMQRLHQPIKGQWRINTDLHLPQALIEPLPEGETVRPNLSLEAQYSTITADVAVEGTSRALLVVKSDTGSVTLRTRREDLQDRPALNIKASTKYSYVAVHLPSSFRGPISWRSRWGTTHFSPAVKARMTQFGQRADTGFEHGFIGDWVGSGYGEVDISKDEWTGDEAVLESETGTVWFYFVDEQHKTLAEKVVGWFGRS